MKTSRKLSVIAFALIALATTVTFAIPIAYADNSQEPPTTIISNQSINNTVALSNSLPVPIVNTTIYNTAVKYSWHAGIGANALGMGYGNTSPVIFNTTNYKEIAYITDGNKECVPHYYWGMSYNSETNSYSDKTTTAWEEETGDHIFKVHYGHNAKYTVVGKLNKAMISGDIPTSYDQTNFIWDNNAKNYHIIKGTISYHGYISDIEVSVPPLGYKTTSVTLDGVTFSLRTGPWKCSIKVNKAGQSVSTLGFAFGVL